MNRIRRLLGRLVTRIGSIARNLEADAVLGQFAAVGSEVYLKMPMVIYHPERIFLGSYIGIGENVILRGGAEIRIGNQVNIAAGAAIVSVGHPLSPPRWARDIGAPITIEDDVWIGVNAVVLPGVTIGRGSVVAAGAVVTRDVPEDCVVAGVPARLVKRLPSERYTNFDVHNSE